MITEIQTTEVGEMLGFTKSDFILNWELVILQIQKGKFKSLEDGLRNYKYPNDLPNLTRKLGVKEKYDRTKNCFVDEYNDTVNMYWIIRTDANEEYYFNTNNVYLPSGEVLMFD